MSEDNWTISVDRDEDCSVEFSVTIPSGDVESERKQAINELKQEIEVPGFRKGKVPASIIEKKHPQQVQQALLERLVPRACRKVYQDYDIRPIQNPTIQDFDINEEFHMEATVQEQPRVEVSQDDYLDMSLQKPDDEVTEEAVQEQLDNLLSTQSTLEPIPIARPVEEGDFVKIDFQGFDENGNPLEKTAGEDQVIEVGSDRFLTEIEEGIIGAEEGEQRRLNASFPEDFMDDDLAGRTVNFEVTVKEIQEERSPDPEDEEFLEEMDVDSIDELKDQIRERLQEAGEQEEREELAEQIYDQLLDTYDFSIPESMVEEEIDSIVQDYERQVQAQDRDMEEFLESQDMSRDELREDAREEAERRIRLTLIFQSIAEEEDIEVKEEEFQDHLQELSQDTGMDLDELQELPDEQLNSLRYQLRDDKILDYLIDEANVEIVESEDSENGD